MNIDSTKLIVSVVVIIFLGSLVFTMANCFSHSPGTFTITSKEIYYNSNGSKLLIFTDKTTYTVSDSIINWRWDSADVYGKLEIGKTYSATLQGWRIPFLSMFPNIIDPKEISRVENDYAESSDHSTE